MSLISTVKTLLLPLISTLLILSGCDKNKNSDLKIVAITQIVDHESLDTERAGFIEGLKQGGFEDQKNILIKTELAQGNIATATQIATKFVSLNPALIFALSTPSAQSCVSAASKTTIPVIFSAVTNPVTSKIVSQTEGVRNENVTGISDYIPASIQINCITQLLPNCKKIGVIYNPGEANSVAIVKDIKEAATSQHINIIEATASKTSDVASAAQSLVARGVEAILVPNDNTAVASIESVIVVGEKNHIPVFAADIGSFNAGVVAVVGYDRFLLGKRAAAYAIKILNGEKANTLPVIMDHPVAYKVNLSAAKRMGLKLDPTENTKELEGFDIVETVDHSHHAEKHHRNATYRKPF